MKFSKVVLQKKHLNNTIRNNIKKYDRQVLVQ